MIRYFVLFLIGALVVPVGDVVHVLTQTTSYPPEQMVYSIFGVIPWWVPLLFGSAGVLSGLHTELVRKKFPRNRDAKPLEFIAATVAFLGMYFLSGLLPKTFITDGVLLFCGSLLFLFSGDRTLGGVFQAFGIVLGGTGFEIFLVQNHVFSYAPPHNELWGVAPWLPWLYVGVAVAVDTFLKWWKLKAF